MSIEKKVSDSIWDSVWYAVRDFVQFPMSFSITNSASLDVRVLFFPPNPDPVNLSVTRFFKDFNYEK